MSNFELAPIFGGNFTLGYVVRIAGPGVEVVEGVVLLGSGEKFGGSGCL